MRTVFLIKDVVTGLYLLDNYPSGLDSTFVELSKASRFENYQEAETKLKEEDFEGYYQIVKILLKF